MHEFEAIEDALLTKLGTISGVSTLIAHAGTLGLEEINVLVKDYPAIIVVVSELRNERINRSDEKEVDITLVVADRNRWNIKGTTGIVRGDGVSLGVYALLEAAKEKLHDLKLLDGWTFPKRQREIPLGYDAERNMGAYAAHYIIRTKG